ncbi:eukaryotic translation initiation factor 4 gamma 3-like [Artemia franciscana]|uniref:eukaryotic translation initiation factor 4 gamma 3-like n=1 Tax=Artemia franciscana TaxID=6661 RepID=UPI0032DA5DDB
MTLCAELRAEDKETAARIWHASGLTWESFGAKTSYNVEQLISSKNLDFTRNSPGSHLASHPERREPSSKKFSSESRNQLYRIFKESSRDDAIAQAQERIPSDEKSLPGFVRDVVTVITDICLQGDSQHKEINKTQFIEWTEFISKLISNSQELELQALYAVQSIDNKLAHPKGFINDMAFILYEKDVISEQAFILWKDSPPTSEHEGHAICMKSLNRFFQALATDDEESSKA